jgi:hypothetical protein
MELNDLYRNVVRLVKSGKLRLAGHEAGMEETRNACRILWIILLQTVLMQDREYGRITLRWRSPDSSVV